MTEHHRMKSATLALTLALAASHAACASPPAAGEPTNALRVRFTCTNGEAIEVRFFRLQGVAVLVRQGRTYELQQERSGSGFRYAGGAVGIRGKGEDLTVEIGGMAPLQCTAVPAAPAVQLIDPAIPAAIAGQAGWNYRQSAQADLDGDGRPERVVLTARVELVRGRPAWDDGQPWQVYIEAGTGQRTRVYAQRLQLGTLALRITAGGPGQAPAILLLEHLPDRLAIHEVRYAGPGKLTVTTPLQRQLDPRGETAGPRLP
jgi:membrane-bound inhibitor of C-type lysozyme